MTVADEDVPWAMQLVALVPRVAPPTRTAVCECAATAVVTLLSDARTVDGPWRESVGYWTERRIRKVVRRARGAPWEAAQTIDGVTADVSGARVRAFVPGPVDAVPPALGRLQVGGTDVPDRGEPSPDAPPGLTIAVTPAVTMTTGKAAAQCGHAAQLALAAMSPSQRADWERRGFALRVVFAAAGAWPDQRARAAVTVIDGGFTEVAPGTLTAVASWAGLP